MSFFILLNTKKNILKKDGNQAYPVPCLILSHFHTTEAIRINNSYRSKTTLGRVHDNRSLIFGWTMLFEANILNKIIVTISNLLFPLPTSLQWISIQFKVQSRFIRCIKNHRVFFPSEYLATTADGFLQTQHRNTHFVKTGKECYMEWSTCAHTHVHEHKCTPDTHICYKHIYTTRDYQQWSSSYRNLSNTIKSILYYFSILFRIWILPKTINQTVVFYRLTALATLLHSQLDPCQPMKLH